MRIARLVPPLASGCPSPAPYPETHVRHNRLRAPASLLFSLSVVLLVVTLLTPAAAGESFFLHTAASDTLDQRGPTATVAKFRDSPALTRTTFQPIGTWSAAPSERAMRLESMSDLHVWLGLKNSDDQGTYFDLRAEVRKNGIVVAAGQTTTIQGVTRDPSKAKEVLVSFGAVSDPAFEPGDVLSLRLLAKVASSGGHSNAVGVRAYYDAVHRASRFGATFTLGSPPTIVITAPAPGTVLDQDTVLVKGAVTAPSGAAVGVTVNGVVAGVSDGQFAVFLPVDWTVTSLTAVAKDAAGSTASDTIAVAANTSIRPAIVFLRPTPAGGVAPLTVSFSVSSLVPVADIALDADGNGSIDFLGSSLDGQAFDNGVPGLYFPSVVVTDNLGQRYTAMTVVQIYDRVALDAVLQARWRGMKDALRAGDIASALTHIVGAARRRYDEAFRLITAHLPGIDGILTTPTLLDVWGQAATYEATRTDDGLPKSFEVRFRVDEEDGIWRIEAF